MNAIFRAYCVSLATLRFVKKAWADVDSMAWLHKERPLLRQFKDKHLGEDCFIIGNGPSLNKMDLSPLKEYHTFGLNKIHLLFDRQPLQLSYHVAVNPLVIEQMKPVLENHVFQCPSFISFKASRNIINDRSHLFRLLTNGVWSFYPDIANPIEEGYTVTFVAMQIAYYMGFKNVFLIGMDHNFQQKGKPNEEQLMESDDSNHFHPGYFKGQKWHLADLEGSEASYALAKHFFHQAGREIYNATVDGNLAIFPRMAFSDALSLAKKKGAAY